VYAECKGIMNNQKKSSSGKGGRRTIFMARFSVKLA
jgi:hypothetical protein